MDFDRSVELVATTPSTERIRTKTQSLQVVRKKSDRVECRESEDNTYLLSRNTMTIAMYAMRRRAEHMPESVGLWLERKEDERGVCSSRTVQFPRKKETMPNEHEGHREMSLNTFRSHIPSSGGRYS